ncbi:MAG: Pyruvate dehydrogenase (Lipoamide) [uncultured bacterium]|nr:MAG: Pyruvate dehydrogenase (Lipoamide) [uncultured bacterium]HLB42531.1 thiamine pyrophosphate-dependent dehydrogenase E1 component subunit alpha [Gammaproteobacteria bacterium]
MNTQVSQSNLERLYSIALKIRMVEEAIALHYPKGEMRTPIHLCTGQEANPAGVCAALTDEDIVYAYYRSHGWYLAKGGDLNKMVAELFGKATGCSKGFGGSMHIIDLNRGFAGTTALVAAAQAHAVGAAFTFKSRKQNRVAVSSFGDGATEEGIFQESLMFAALRKLPVIFICENNGLATNTWIKYRQPEASIYKRAEGFGVHSVLVDGNNAVMVFQAAQEAVNRAKAGEGPSFIECKTYRMLEHCGPNNDIALGFRTEAEVASWKEKDPIQFLEKQVGTELSSKLRKQYQIDIDSALDEARNAAFPTHLFPERDICQ